MLLGAPGSGQLALLGNSEWALDVHLIRYDLKKSPFALPDVTLKGGYGQGSYSALSPDGERVALLNYSRNAIEIWAAADGKSISKIEMPKGGKEYSWDIELEYAAAVKGAGGEIIYLLHPKLDTPPAP